MRDLVRHFCIDPSYPLGRIVCWCQRSEDHNEAQFDTPKDED